VSTASALSVRHPHLRHSIAFVVHPHRVLCGTTWCGCRAIVVFVHRGTTVVVVCGHRGTTWRARDGQVGVFVCCRTTWWAVGGHCHGVWAARCMIDADGMGTRGWARQWTIRRTEMELVARASSRRCCGGGKGAQCTAVATAPHRRERKLWGGDGCQ
jgi:hypothetical protein